jgi:hypothetical protein
MRWRRSCSFHSGAKTPPHSTQYFRAPGMLFIERNPSYLGGSRGLSLDRPIKKATADRHLQRIPASPAGSRSKIFQVAIGVLSPSSAQNSINRQASQNRTPIRLLKDACMTFCQRCIFGRRPTAMRIDFAPRYARFAISALPRRLTDRA